MTEPVASKYEIAYWVKLIGLLVIIVVGVIVIIYYGGNDDSENRLQNIYTTLGLFLAITVGTAAATLRASFPRKILVETEQILIDYFVINKHIVINYIDIDKLSTTRPYNSGGIFSQINNGQTLVIELYDGKRYNISENDFEKYDGLKSAIYDHVFRHR